MENVQDNTEENTENSQTKEPVYHLAKVIALPAKWNSFCYIVESKEMGKDSPMYFSESAMGKPVNKQVDEEGFIYKQMIGPESYIYIWKNDKT
jgi:hypothetical protein